MRTPNVLLGIAAAAAIAGCKPAEPVKPCPGLDEAEGFATFVLPDGAEGWVQQGVKCDVNVSQDERYRGNDIVYLRGTPEQIDGLFDPSQTYLQLRDGVLAVMDAEASEFAAGSDYSSSAPEMTVRVTTGSEGDCSDMTRSAELNDGHTGIPVVLSETIRSERGMAEVGIKLFDNGQQRVSTPRSGNSGSISRRLPGNAPDNNLPVPSDWIKNGPECPQVN